MRIVLSMIGGVGVAFGLFYLMANLISMGKHDLKDASENVAIDFEYMVVFYM